MAVSLGLEPRITVPKTVVMIHFTKRPIKIFLYNVIQFNGTCTKLALNFFGKKVYKL